MRYLVLTASLILSNCCAVNLSELKVSEVCFNSTAYVGPYELSTEDISIESTYSPKTFAQLAKMGFKSNKPKGCKFEIQSALLYSTKDGSIYTLLSILSIFDLSKNGRVPTNSYVEEHYSSVYPNKIIGEMIENAIQSFIRDWKYSH